MTSSVEDAASTPLLSSAEQGNIDDKFSAFKKHVFLGLIIALPSVAPGMCLAFSAETLPQLGLGISYASWFASMIALAIPVGYLTSRPLAERFGRRPALLTSCIVGLIGWLMLAFRPTAPTLAKLFLGRLLTGVATGMASYPAALYASECLGNGDNGPRKGYVTWSTIALSFGILAAYVSGAMISYYQVAGLAAIISIVSFIAVAIFIPESPKWLESKGRDGDAAWIQARYGIAKSAPKTVSEQASTSTEGQQTPSAPSEQQHDPTSLKEIWREIDKPEVHKPLVIMTMFFFFQQFSGVFVFIAYMVDIVRSAGVVALNPYFVTVLSGTIILFVSFAASFIYPKTGVRAIATISGIGMCVTMLFIGLYLSLRPYFLTGSEYYYLRWIPLFAILANVTSSTVGFLILPWSMLGDVFPLSVKGTAAAITTTMGYIFCFIAIKSFPYLWLELGSDGVFYFYGLSALFGTLFVYFFLPETNGKTLEEILDGFSKHKK